MKGRISRIVGSVYLWLRPSSISPGSFVGYSLVPVDRVDVRQMTEESRRSGPVSRKVGPMLKGVRVTEIITFRMKYECKPNERYLFDEYGLWCPYMSTGWWVGLKATSLKFVKGAPPLKFAGAGSTNF